MSSGSQGYGDYPQPGYPPGGCSPPQGYPQSEFKGAPPAPDFINPNHPDPKQGFAPPPDFSNDDGLTDILFEDKKIRKAFIRKVYAILMVQLVIIFGFIGLFLLHKPTQIYATQHPAILWVALVVMFITILSMAYSTSVRRKSPMNLIFLTVFTLAQAFILAVTSSIYRSTEVLLAVGIMALICSAVTFFAFYTKRDFTKLGRFLLVGMVVLFVLGIMAINDHGMIIILVYSLSAALYFSFYLVYITQMMMGGNHNSSISPDEYIFTALNLFFVVNNICLYILTIIGLTSVGIAVPIPILIPVICYFTGNKPLVEPVLKQDIPI
ncbi:protein lifeguard 2-like [Arctopsyche grandis]|uniref:protein lifeguard 2-like n=1 Tax=Arctopsyche grandis TaxID=121162 RepID=UPI00406D79E7